MDILKKMVYIIITARDKRAATDGPGSSRIFPLKSLKSHKGAGWLRQVDRFTFRVYSLQSARPHKYLDNGISAPL